jgi:hypothetical protein
MESNKAEIIDEQILKNLSPKDCLLAYKQVLEFSNNLEAAALLLAENNFHGIAISNLIISNEEAIKAFMLFLEGNDFGLRTIPGFASIFDNHRLRYLVALLMVVADILMEDFKKYCLLFFQNPKEIIEFLSLEPAEIVERFKNYLKSRFSTIKTEIDWFSKIDNARQMGFYSNSFSYSDKQINSMKITKEDFEIFKNKIIRINSGINEFLKYLDGDSELQQKQLSFFRDSFRDKGVIYKEIGEVLNTIKYPNYDSYGSLHQFLEELYNKAQETKPEEFYDQITKGKTELISKMEKLEKPIEKMKKAVKRKPKEQ